MDRRQFVTLAASALAASAAPAAVIARARRGSKPKVGVIGGGIVGASIAMHCARAGAEVILFEKAAPASGATAKSFAFINPFADDAAYTRLRLASVLQWQKLHSRFDMGVTWGGYVDFTDREAERGRLSAETRLLADSRHAPRVVDAARLQQISPALHPGNLVEARWCDLAGHVDPVLATSRFLSLATAAGATVRYPLAVTAIEPGTAGGQCIVVTPEGRVPFDYVVVANGVDAPAMLKPFGFDLKLLHRPGAIMHSKPVAAVTRIVHAGPGELAWKQMADGTVVAYEIQNPPPLPVHAEIRDHVLDFPPGIAEMHGQRILSKVSAYMPALGAAAYDHMTIGFRPVPEDGMPVVGPVPGVPGLAVCVTHSGVTLASGLGDYVSSELIDGREEPLLAPYRPSRLVAAKSAA